MKILVFASTYNGMCQRVHKELEAEGQEVSIELSPHPQQMLAAATAFQPDLILCPFLMHAVPAQICQQYTCLILRTGIESERGPWSLDWAIAGKHSSCHVTLLQATAEMNSGAIWDTQTMHVRNAAKTNIYRRDVIAIAVQMLKNVLHNNYNLSARSLNHKNASVHGEYLPFSPQELHGIDWMKDSTEVITRKINAADGALDTIAGNDVYVFGARPEYSLHSSTPGEIIGHRDGAICRATIDGSLWIRQLKMASQQAQDFLKLPALHVLTQQFPNAQLFENLHLINSKLQNDIKIEVKNAVAYVSFDFYNGAMNTEQCRHLLSHLRDLREQSDIRVIALLGGEDFWSNGIHLHCIQAAADPARESWRNINAIDDLVQELITMTNKLTVAALRNNASAGGAIMPLACDKIFAREGVVLNPHYVNTGLFGSEYWTYLLPKRAGATKAQELIAKGLPVLAAQAKKFGMIDKVLLEDWNAYHALLQRECEALADDSCYFPLLARKQYIRMRDEALQPLDSYRQQELQQMKAIFDNPHSDYHTLRYNFVHKINSNKTPARLIFSRRGENSYNASNHSGSV